MPFLLRQLLARLREPLSRTAILACLLLAATPALTAETESLSFAASVQAIARAHLESDPAAVVARTEALTARHGEAPWETDPALGQTLLPLYLDACFDSGQPPPDAAWLAFLLPDERRLKNVADFDEAVWHSIGDALSLLPEEYLELRNLFDDRWAMQFPHAPLPSLFVYQQSFSLCCPGGSVGPHPAPAHGLRKITEMARASAEGEHAFLAYFLLSRKHLTSSNYGRLRLQVHCSALDRAIHNEEWLPALEMAFNFPQEEAHAVALQLRLAHIFAALGRLPEAYARTVWAMTEAQTAEERTAAETLRARILRQANETPDAPGSRLLHVLLASNVPFPALPSADEPTVTTETAPWVFADNLPPVEVLSRWPAREPRPVRWQDRTYIGQPLRLDVNVLTLRVHTDGGEADLPLRMEEGHWQADFVDSQEKGMEESTAMWTFRLAFAGATEPYPEVAYLHPRTPAEATAALEAVFARYSADELATPRGRHALRLAGEAIQEVPDDPRTPVVLDALHHLAIREPLTRNAERFRKLLLEHEDTPTAHALPRAAEALALLHPRDAGAYDALRTIQRSLERGGHGDYARLLAEEIETREEIRQALYERSRKQASGP